MLVVVGGHSRRVGKTSVVAGIIRALPEAGWTAVKVAPHAHFPSAMLEEKDRGARRDTSRFLAAGARRAVLVCSAARGWRRSLRRLVASAGNAIVESNSVLAFLRPDLYLLVLDCSIADFKESARDAFGLADAFIVVDRGRARPAWNGVADGRLEDKPRFQVQPPAYMFPELAEFVRGRLEPG